MSNWQKVNLDKLCFFEKGKTGLAKAIPGDYPLVTTSAERKTNDSYQFDTKAVCIPLVSSTGHGHASLNYVHYQEGKFALGTILVALIPKDETILNAQFLHLYLSRLKDMILVPLMSGAANVSLSISKIKTVEIPLPPIDEQLKIVELFKNLLNENNELVEEINTQQSLLKQLKQTILQEAIEGKLTAKYRAKNPDIGTAKELLEQIKTEKEQLVKDKKIKASKPLAPINEDEIPFDIPPTWEWYRLGDYSINRDGERKPISQIERENRAKIYDYYGASGVIDKIDGYTHDGIFLLIGEDGANLISRTTPIAFIANGKFWVNNHAHVLEFLNIVSLSYVEKYINAINLKPYVTGGFQPKLSQANLNNILISIPPIEEQKEIVATIEKLFAICDELEAEINQNKTTVDNLMATVLKEAFEQQ